MTDATKFLDGAARLLADDGAGLRTLSEQVQELAKRFQVGADWLAARSIGTRIGGGAAWQGDNRSLYYFGPQPPGPQSDYDQANWRHVSEEEAKDIVEEHAGLTYEDLYEPWEEMAPRAERVRRAVLAELEPVAQDDHYAFAREEIAALRHEQLNFTRNEAIHSRRPTSFIVSRPDEVLATPLHVANLGNSLAAAASATAVLKMLDELADLTRRMRNRAELTPQHRRSPSTSARAADESQKLADASIGAVPRGAVALLTVWCVFAALGLVAVLKAGWLGHGKSSIWLKAAVVAALATAIYYLARHLVGERWSRVAAGVGVFVAVFGVAAVVFDSLT